MHRGILLRRLVAGAIDALLMAALAATAMYTAAKFAAGWESAANFGAVFAAASGLAVLDYLYGRTPGKIAMGLSLISAGGKPTPLACFVRRYLAFLGPAVLCVVTGCLNELQTSPHRLWSWAAEAAPLFALAGWPLGVVTSRGWCGLHDCAAGTFVVRTRFDASAPKVPIFRTAATTVFAFVLLCAVVGQMVGLGELERRLGAGEDQPTARRLPASAFDPGVSEAQGIAGPAADISSGEVEAADWWQPTGRDTLANLFRRRGSAEAVARRVGYTINVNLRALADTTRLRLAAGSVARQWASGNAGEAIIVVAFKFELDGPGLYFSEQRTYVALVASKRVAEVAALPGRTLGGGLYMRAGDGFDA